MKTTLLGFLGRGPFSQQGPRRIYRTGNYAFGEWESDDVSFFLCAALHWLREKKQTAPDRVVVLGTTGSMWDELLLALNSAEGSSGEEADAFYYELAQRVDNQSVTADDLEQVQAQLSEALEVDFRTELIPSGREKGEQAAVLDAMQRHVEPKDRVYLDVTHGFRHQPMLALGAAVLLSRLRNAHIEEVFYGANEMKSYRDGPAPVVSLKWLLDLLAWADGIQQFRGGGRLRGLAHATRDGRLQQGLEEVAFLLSTNQIREVGKAANRCRRILRETPPDPILDLTRKALDEALVQLAGSRRDSDGILALARAALNEQEYVRVSILLNEALAEIQREAGHELRGRRPTEIRQLRNALAHAGKKKRMDSVTQALSSRKQMVKMLTAQLDWIDSRLPRTLVQSK